MSSQNSEFEDIKFIPVAIPTSAIKNHEADFQCGICSASFSSNLSLLEHVQEKHGKKRRSRQDQLPRIEPKSCANGSVKFRNDLDLHKHRRSGCQVQDGVQKNVPEKIHQHGQQSQNASNQCSKCGMNFRFRVQLSTHCKIHEPIQVNFDEAEGKEERPAGKNQPKTEKSDQVCVRGKLYSCPKSGCDYQAKFPYQIETHLKCKHQEGGEPFKCELCPFQTLLKGNLKQHQRIHSEEKRFACSFPDCDFRSHWAGNLKVHQSRHAVKKARPEPVLTVKSVLPKFDKRTPQTLPEVLKPKTNPENLLPMTRKSSRQRSQVYHSLCEELLIDECQNEPSFGLQNSHLPPADFGTADQRMFSGVSEVPEFDPTISDDGIFTDLKEIGTPSMNMTQVLEESNIITPNLWSLSSNDSEEPEITVKLELQNTSDQSDLDIKVTQVQIPGVPAPSDLREIKFSERISPEESTKEAEMSQPVVAAPAPLTSVQKKIKKESKTKRSFKSRGSMSSPAGLKRKGDAENAVQCPHCPYRTKTEWLLRGHLVGHGAAKPLCCSMENCNFQTKWQNMLYSHTRKVHSSRYFKPGSKRKPKSGIIGEQKSGSGRSSQPIKSPHSAEPNDPPELTSKITENVMKPQKDPNSKFFLCPFPDCVFESLYDFNVSRHVKTHQKIGTFSHSCAKCHGKFPNMSSLGRHTRHCRRKLSSSPDLKSSSSISGKTSKLQHQKAKLYTCPVRDCNFKTCITAGALSHQKSHATYGIFTHSCAVCQRKFATAAALLRHGPKCTRIAPASQTAKKSGDSLEYSGAEGKLYTCVVPDCNFTTLNRTNLMTHRRSHEKYGNFIHKCTDCQRKFATPAALHRHGPKCTKTPASVSRRHEVKQKHVRTSLSPPALALEVPQETNRSQQKPAIRRLDKAKAFECPHGSCTFRATTFKNLNIHQGMAHGISAKVKVSSAERHHLSAPRKSIVQETPKIKVQVSAVKGKTLKCPECPYEASNAWLLNRHSIIHTSERSFACPLCPYKARFPWNLKNHQLCRHSRVMPSKLRGESSCDETISTHDAAKLVPGVVSDVGSSAASSGCTFCSYMSRLAKYLTKHITKCPGCHKSTNPSPPQISAST